MKLCLQPKHILGALLYRIPLFNKKRLTQALNTCLFKHIITSAHTKYCLASILSHIVSFYFLYLIKNR